MHWSESQSPMPTKSTVKKLHPTDYRSQKGCGGEGMSTRMIHAGGTCRKGQYDRSGLAPSGRGMDDVAGKVSR